MCFLSGGKFEKKHTFFSEFIFWLRKIISYFPQWMGEEILGKYLTFPQQWEKLWGKIKIFLMNIVFFSRRFAPECFSLLISTLIVDFRALRARKSDPPPLLLKFPQSTSKTSKFPQSTSKILRHCGREKKLYRILLERSVTLTVMIQIKSGLSEV